MSFHVVIPARHASTRLPGKPLLDIGGRPMIQRVVEQASASGAAQVLVATDDERIVAAVRDPRGRSPRIAIMTDPSLPSGTDRVAAVSLSRNRWQRDEARKRGHGQHDPDDRGIEAFRLQPHRKKRHLNAK